MLDWLARVLGKEVVYLIDFDGVLSKRWAKKTPLGLMCWRCRFVRQVLLLPGGKIKGDSYVTEWRYADGRKEDE
jgi:hypothetical protein